MWFSSFCFPFVFFCISKCAWSLLSFACWYQVLGESLCITIDNLNTEEKVVVANSKVESIEVECSKLRKDLIVAMNERNDMNEKIKELTEALRVEKALAVQKDEKIQAALLKTDTERDKVILKFK